MSRILLGEFVLKFVLGIALVGHFMAACFPNSLIPQQEQRAFLQQLRLVRTADSTSTLECKAAHSFRC